MDIANIDNENYNNDILVSKELILLTY